ncbi:MAG: DNA repair protein RecO [Bacteroidota bacterium]
MLHKTRGIVLSHTKYRETSLIVRMLTEHFGVQSYLIQRVRTTKPRYGIALFQPLTLLDMVVYHRKQGGLQRVSEVRCCQPMTGILGNLQKATIAVFLAELLAKAIREEESNAPFFQFLWQSIGHFNEQQQNYTLFHLAFMLRLCHYLGFGIKDAQEIAAQLRRAGQHKGLSAQNTQLLNALLRGQPLAGLATDRATIRTLLSTLVRFYQLHIEALDTLQSLRVLQELG